MTVSIVIQSRTYLVAHVVIGSTVEVIVRPLSERGFTDLGVGAMIIERVLGVGLEEFRLLH